MNKIIFLIVAIGTLFFSACNKPISTTDEWVSFCKSNPDAKSIYDMYESMTLANCIEIFGKLEAELENNNNCTKEKSYAFTYILHLLSFDWDTHPERFGDNDRDRLNEVFHRHYFFVALYNASKQTGDTQTGAISTEIQTLARLFGSKMMQESTMTDEEVLSILADSKYQTSEPYYEDNADELQPLDGYEEINDEPTDEDVILPYSTDEIAPEY